MSNHIQGTLTIWTPPGKERPISIYADDHLICEVPIIRSLTESKANAERLVLTWNCHDDLLAVCKAAVTVFQRTKGASNDLGGVPEAIVILEAAIAKTETN